MIKVALSFCPDIFQFVFMMKATELSTIVTKATIGADWILKRWIKFQIAVKTFEFDKVLNSQIISLV